jgi:hypothetical protein
MMNLLRTDISPLLRLTQCVFIRRCIGQLANQLEKDQVLVLWGPSTLGTWYGALQDKTTTC